MSPLTQDVENIFRVFQNFLKVSGMSCFCYPRKTFKTSIVGSGFIVFNSILCLSLFLISTQSFENNSTQKLSAVYLYGLVTIEVVIRSSMLLCLWVNFFLRKRIFSTLKMFEKFDKVRILIFQVVF